MRGDAQSAAAPPPPPPPPPRWCSSTPLYSLIVFSSVSADCPLVLVSQGQAEEEGLNICSWRRPGNRQMDGNTWRELKPLAKNSGGKDKQKMRRGRRREAAEGVCGSLMKGGRRRRRFIEWSDLIIKDPSLNYNGGEMKENDGGFCGTRPKLISLPF